MSRCAIFIDAGYLFAQGSTAIAGKRLARSSLVLDPAKVVSGLRKLMSSKATNTELLRVYWYDGAIGGERPTSDQAALAILDDVKLRLGFVNSQGQQKGVDSLIVTDLIELARLNSISDAILLSGDEDVRIGVQIAQNYGVRVHLLGIAPSRGSQSIQLLQEADTTTEWGADRVGEFLSIHAVDAAYGPSPQATQSGAAYRAAAKSDVLTDDKVIGACVERFASNLTQPEIDSLFAYWKTDRGIPSDLDRKLLQLCSTSLGRSLEPEETKTLRRTFKLRIRSAGNR